MPIEMTKCVMCLNWFCFCMYYKGWSEYSTIGSHSSSSADNMSEHKSSTPVEFDTCENCTKLSIDGNDDEKTTAMVSQAEIWQEDKKFTVPILHLFLSKMINHVNNSIDVLN